MSTGGKSPCPVKPPGFGDWLLIGDLACCISFEQDAVVALKGVGTGLAAEITEERDHHWSSRHLLLAERGAQVRDELLANHAGDRQRKFGPGPLLSAMGFKAGSLIRSHLVESHRDVGLGHRMSRVSDGRQAPTAKRT